MDTFGVPFAAEVGDDRTRHTALSLTVPASVPVREQDMALYAGRDYIVRGVEGGGDFVKRIQLEEAD